MTPSNRSSSTTTTSTSVRTSREVTTDRPDDQTPRGTDHDQESDTRSDVSLPSTTISTPSSSSANSDSGPSNSTANSPTNLPEDAVVAKAIETIEHVESSTTPSYVHGHLLPAGWTCRHDPKTDEFSFEYAEPDIGVNKPTRPKTMPSVHQIEPQASVGAAHSPKPTQDDSVQTSRRPTLDLFECQFGYHFPSSPTSSMISELARQVQRSTTGGAAAKQQTAPKTRQIGYGKNKLVVPSDEEEQTRRLHDMFPTAPVPIIEQMIRIYHGREGLIKAALISLGYKRSSEYGSQQATAQSPILMMMSKASSKKLFDKLVGYFPDKDETLIKRLMYQHKEVEHEIISALVESTRDSGGRRSAHGQRVHLEASMRGADQNGAIMKLRYLKFLYPTCEEIELYHLLNCNDLNAQVVMDLVEKRGHKRINVEEVMQNRKSQTQQMRAQQAAHAAQDKAPGTSASDLVKAHVSRPRPTVSDARVASLKANLKKTIGGDQELNDKLLLGALEATDYNEPLARKFLQEMKPANDAEFTRRYEISREPKPDVVAYPCKAIQKGDSNFMSIIANEFVHIPRKVVECENALALLKVDAATFTQEDFQPTKFTHRQGPQLGLAHGPSPSRYQARHIRRHRHRGPQASLRTGSRYDEICADVERPRPTTKAIGHKSCLVQGRNLLLPTGHNPALLQRVHPFFDTTIKG